MSAQIRTSLINSYELSHRCDVNIDMLSLGHKVDIRLPSVDNYGLDKDEKFQDFLKLDSSNDLDEVKYVRFLATSELLERKLTNKVYFNGSPSHE